jgi:hypothetical protein
LAYWGATACGVHANKTDALLKAPMTGDFLKVAKWTNPDTAVFWAFAADVEAGALFELKVDGEGNWKLVKAKVLFGKAAEKEQGW